MFGVFNSMKKSILHRIGGLETYEVAGYQVLFESDTYRREKYWLKGHHDLPCSRKIWGHSGPETEYVTTISKEPIFYDKN
jgi:hypothetical protein